jgi:hypothetical protein
MSELLTWSGRAPPVRALPVEKNLFDLKGIAFRQPLPMVTGHRPLLEAPCLTERATNRFTPAIIDFLKPDLAFDMIGNGLGVGIGTDGVIGNGLFNAHWPKHSL